MEFLARVWRGEESFAAVIVYLLLVPLVVACGFSEWCFGLDNRYHLPLFALYFWYMIVALYAAGALIYVVRACTFIKDASLRGLAYILVVFCAVPMLALPMARFYANYLSSEQERLQNLVLEKEKQQMTHHRAVETIPAAHGASDTQMLQQQYDASIEKYQELKRQRDMRREQGY